MVADVHRTLVSGGIFMYPPSDSSPNGKVSFNFIFTTFDWFILLIGWAFKNILACNYAIFPSTLVIWPNTYERITTSASTHQCLSVRSLVSKVCCSLYGTESLAILWPQESELNVFHAFNLWFILGKTWEDIMINKKIFEITNSGPLPPILKFFRLCWAGHVSRMPQQRISSASNWTGIEWLPWAAQKFKIKLNK